MTPTRQNILFAALIVGALVVEVLILVWFFGGSEESDEPVIADRSEERFGNTEECGKPPLSVSAPGARFDEAKRFAVEVPRAWNSEADGSIVKLTKKNGRATLSVGRAQPGALSTAFEDLRESLRLSYEDLDITSDDWLVLDGCPARSVKGTARNRRGAALNFEGVVVAGPADNFVIAGFLERNAEPRLDAQVRRLVRSVRFYLSEDRDPPARS